MEEEEFMAWVRETAENRDMPVTEVISELISAYWVIDDIADAVDKASFETTTQPSEADDDKRSTPDISDIPVSDKKSVQDTKNGPADETLCLLIRALQASDQNTPTDEVSEEKLAGVAETLSDLRRRIESIENDTKQYSKKSDVSTIAQYLRIVATEVADLEEAMAEFDKRVDTRLSEFEGDVEGLQQQHTDFEADIEAELDAIEAAFSRFEQRTNAIDERIKEVTAAYRNDMEYLQRRHAREEQLTELKQTAAKHGIDTAACDACGAKATLSLLAAPECPACGATFSGVVPSGWDPFQSASLETGPVDSMSEPPRSATTDRGQDGSEAERDRPPETDRWIWNNAESSSEFSSLDYER